MIFFRSIDTEELYEHKLLTTADMFHVLHCRLPKLSTFVTLQKFSRWISSTPWIWEAQRKFDERGCMPGECWGRRTLPERIGCENETATNNDHEATNALVLQQGRCICEVVSIMPNHGARRRQEFKIGEVELQAIY